MFTSELNKAIFGREIIEPNVPLIFFTCDSQDWVDSLASLFEPCSPIPTPRRHSVCRKFDQDWMSTLQGRFSIEYMDQSLLERPGLDIPDEVRLTLQKWHHMDNPRLADFGFVAIDNSSKPAKVAAWATIDFVAGGKGDLGMFTQEKYRKQGLAYWTTAACLSHGLNNGLNAIFWTCMEDNSGSIHTAEKLGLVREANYNMYLLILDPVQHRATMAYYLMESGQPREAVEILEEIIASGTECPDWIYFDAASAWAILGNKANAIIHLNHLVKRGANNIKVYEENEAFRSLQDTPEWQNFLQRVQENNKKG
jgi:RimJ/RimL family protein N-acetyltransferase